MIKYMDFNGFRYKSSKPIGTLLNALDVTLQTFYNAKKHRKEADNGAFMMRSRKKKGYIFFIDELN